MTRRVQGGTAGILAALETGRLDPLNPVLHEEPHLRGLSNADRRAIQRRADRRTRRLASRSPF